MKRKAPIPAEHRAEMLREAMASLVTDTRFEVFMDEVNQMRETAIRDSLNDSVMGDLGKMAAGLAEIRSYTSILDLYETYVLAPPAKTEPPQE